MLEVLLDGWALRVPKVGPTQNPTEIYGMDNREKVCTYK